MTGQIGFVCSLLLLTMILFTSNRVRPDVVALLVVIALILSGLLSVNEAFAGFSDPIVFLIAGTFAVGEGLVRTGIAYTIGAWLLHKAGADEIRLMVWLMLVVAGLGAFISSTPLVAIFIPIVLSLCNKTGISPGRLLMPLAVAALVSGMLTLIATAPNLVVNGELRRSGLTPFNFFSFTPIGLAVLAVSLVYMLSIGRRLLPVQPQAKTPLRQRSTLLELAKAYNLIGHGYRLRVAAQSTLIGQSVREAMLRARYGVTLTGIERRVSSATNVLPAWAHAVIQRGDVLLVLGDEAKVSALVNQTGLEKLALDDTHRQRLRKELGAAEVMLPPESKLIGNTLREAAFRERHGLTVVAIKRKGESLAGDLGQEKLAFGDTMLVAGSWEQIGLLQTDPRDFLVLRLPAEVDEVAPARRQAPYALLILLAMVGLMTFDLMPHVVAVLLAALAMGLFGCIEMKGVYQSINWQSLVLVAGMLPLAAALQKTGTLQLIVDGLVAGLWHIGPYGMLGSVFLLTAGISLFISNTATAILMAPVAISTAQTLGVSPYPFAMTVAIAASAAFVTPVASPVNTLVMGPGDFRFNDYLRLGLPLLFLTMVVTILVVSVLFPL
jgi:di/tricarboxylate transporter